MNGWNKATGILFLITVSNFFSGVLKAADDTAEHKARSLIDAQVRTILRVAHPTTKFNRADYKGVDSLRDGFRMYYDFHYASALKKKHMLAMTFDFESGGKFSTCTVKSDSGKVKAFTACDLASDILKDLVKTKLVVNPKAKNPAAEQLKGLLFNQATRKVEAKFLLELWLKAQQNK